MLYRAHYVSRAVEEALIREKVPYVLYSGVEFYKRKEIKDILCYLRMIYSGDDISFLRTVNEPRRGVGRTRIAFLKEYAARGIRASIRRFWRTWNRRCSGRAVPRSMCA